MENSTVIFKPTHIPRLVLGLSILFGGAAFAQDAADEDLPAAPPLVPVEVMEPEGPPPEVLPPTTVVGRPSPFPASPLGEGTVTTPTRTETSAANIGSSLTVITEEQLAETEQTSVLEVLRDVPGLDVVQQSGPGSLSSVFIRGANSQQTKVMLDGIPLNDPSNAGRSFNFAYLSVDNIQQVEVLRGPQSGLWGSDAMGGVINIITKRGEGPMKFRANLMGGSYGTTREAIDLSGGTDRVYYSFGGSYLQDDGFNAAALDPGGDLDGTRFGNCSGRFGWTPTDDFDVDYVFRWIDLDTDIDDSPRSDNPNRQNWSNVFFTRVQSRLMLLDGFWEQRVGFNFADYNRIDTDPGFWGVPQFLGQTRKVDYQSNFFLGEDHTLTVGADYRDEQAGGSSPPSPAAQSLAGIYFQDQITVADRWFTTAAFRWDDHSVAGPASTYRVTTLYRTPNTGTAFHGSIGTGFRAPALAENMWAPVGVTLRPERSKGWDCGLEQRFGERLVVDGTYFRNDFVDLIQLNPATWELENVGRAMSSGVEVTGRYRLNPWNVIAGNYTYTFTRDLTAGDPLMSGQPLLRRPPHKASLGIHRDLYANRGKLYLDLLYVGPRDDIDYPPWPAPAARPVLREYCLLKLAGSYDLGERSQLFMRFDNVLNQDYEEVFGYNTARFSFFGGLKLTR